MAPRGGTRDSGTISASVEFGVLPYEVANLSRTGLEVVREIAPEAEDWEIQRELGLLDLAREITGAAPFPASPTGERTKVLLAAMFLKEECLLADRRAHQPSGPGGTAEAGGAIWPGSGDFCWYPMTGRS